MRADRPWSSVIDATHDVWVAAGRPRDRDHHGEPVEAVRAIRPFSPTALVPLALSRRQPKPMVTAARTPVGDRWRGAIPGPALDPADLVDREVQHARGVSERSGLSVGESEAQLEHAAARDRPGARAGRGPRTDRRLRRRRPRPIGGHRGSDPRAVRSKRGADGRADRPSSPPCRPSAAATSASDGLRPRNWANSASTPRAARSRSARLVGRFIAPNCLAVAAPM